MRGLVFVALLLWGAIAHAQQSDKKAVDSFKSMVAAASKDTLFTDTSYNEQLKGWTKSYLQISDVKYDVKNTDSAINPLVGVASFLVLMKISPPYPSQVEAKRSSDFRDGAVAREFSVTYQLDGRKWKAVRVTYDTSLVGGKVPGRVTRGLEYRPKSKGEMGLMDKALVKWLPGIY